MGNVQSVIERQVCSCYHGYLNGVLCDCYNVTKLLVVRFNDFTFRMLEVTAVLLLYNKHIYILYSLLSTCSVSSGIKML